VWQGAVGAWARKSVRTRAGRTGDDKPSSAEVVMTTGIVVKRVARLAWAIMFSLKRVASEHGQYWVGGLGSR
jgi:hypothetical protein